MGTPQCQAGRSISYQATPAGPARLTGDKTLNKPHNTAGTVMENQPARRGRSMTLSRYVRVGMIIKIPKRETDQAEDSWDHPAG